MGYTIVKDQPIFTTGNNNLFSVSQRFRPAYDMSYNLNVEKTLGGKVMLQVGYVGTEGRRLLSLIDINQLPLGGVGSRPYPNFGVIDEIQSIGTSNFNSLQALLKTTSWHGITSQLSYAWSHSLDEVTQYVGALPSRLHQLQGRLRQLGL